ncbi:uncharacterized protein LOC106641895 [Copidosoma floridanum]|uniref:uncharacterized protein LOC106641895 n=1 Tax=Copidosoma floridanum TaxID=29053 RepID=UPI0006C9E1CD|nr:uncharacterized protein LOC106641895 [Copidosoma floridanum]
MKILDLTVDCEQEIGYFAEYSYGTAEEAYLSSAAFMADVLQKLPVPPHQDTAPTTTAPSRSMPAVSVPNFSGQFCDWLEFKDLFLAIIVCDSRLSNVEKLQQLKTHVQGEAAEMLKTIQLTDANFDVAWKALEDHYTNKRRLVSALVRDLLNLPVITIESASELKALLSGTDNALAVLEQLNRHTDHWDDLIVALTVRKLDTQSFCEWESSICSQTDPPTFAQLDTFIEQRISMLEIISASVKASKVKEKSKSHVALNQSDKRHKCFYCQGKHFLYRCEEFHGKTPQKRRQFVAQKGLCTNCFGSHKLTDCKSSHRCRTCSCNHHTMLHDETSSSAHVTSSGTLPAVYGKDSQIYCHLQLPGTSAVCTTLLPTVLVQLQGPNGHRHIARALLDSASQTTCVTKSLLKRAGIDYKPQEHSLLKIGGFNGPLVHGIAHLKISPLNDDKVKIGFDSQVISLIMKYCPGRHKIQSAWQHLKGLAMADDFCERPSEIELLLGANILPQMLKEGLRIGAPGTPMVQRTIFG